MFLKSFEVVEGLRLLLVATVFLRSKVKTGDCGCGKTR
jgi:hypothetical protein